jgi:hypothetical protein
LIPYSLVAFSRISLFAADFLQEKLCIRQSLAHLEAEIFADANTAVRERILLTHEKQGSRSRSRNRRSRTRTRKRRKESELVKIQEKRVTPELPGFVIGTGVMASA